MQIFKTLPDEIKIPYRGIVNKEWSLILIHFDFILHCFIYCRGCICLYLYWTIVILYALLVDLD